MPANRLRHWKQRYDADAKFVFTRRLKLGLDKKKPWVLPGDPVPSGDVRIKGRLKRWWHAGVIALADWESPEAAREKALAKQAAELEEAREAVAEISERLPDFRARLAELEASDDADPRELEDVRSTIARVREVLYAAGKLGVELPAGILDKPAAGGEPEESSAAAPAGPSPELAATIAAAEALGFRFTVGTDPGVHVLFDGEEMGVFPSIEEALAALDTFDLPPEKPKDGVPAAPQGPAEGSEPQGGADGAGDSEAPEAPAPAQDSPPGPQAPTGLEEILVESTGGGWFSVTVPGEDEPRKVQGEAKLQALLATLGASE